MVLGTRHDSGITIVAEQSFDCWQNFINIELLKFNKCTLRKKILFVLSLQNTFNAVIPRSPFPPEKQYCGQFTVKLTQCSQVKQHNSKYSSLRLRHMDKYIHKNGAYFCYILHIPLYQLSKP